MKLLQQGKIDHTWGFEIVWANTESYCGKILMFEKENASTNLLVHRTKRKSFFVNAGKILFTFIDIKTGQLQSAEIDEGRTIDIAEMTPYSIKALVANSMLFEVGTPEDQEDQFKLSPDDAVQTQQPEQQ